MNYSFIHSVDSSWAVPVLNDNVVIEGNAGKTMLNEKKSGMQNIDNLFADL